MKHGKVPKLVLLDRDGVINQDRPDSVKSVSEFVLLPRVSAAIQRLNKAGVKVAVVTNQAVVGRGVIDPEDLEQIHAYMLEALRAEGACIDRIYACISPDSSHPDRKPNPGLLQKALLDFRAKPEDTPLVGDALRDLEAARTLSCLPYLVLTGKGEKTLEAGLPDYLQPVTICADLWEAVDRLLED